MKIIIIGNGAWGTALAIHFSKRHDTILISRNQRENEKLICDNENKRYLPGFPFPQTLKLQPMETIEANLEDREIVILATPVGFIHSTLATLANYRTNHLSWLIASKGFETETELLPHQLVARHFPNNKRIAVLSGPTFAQEVAAGLPCAICLSSQYAAWVQILAQKLNDCTMKIYTNVDPIGTAVGGAVKNIIAIASGFCDGKQMGNNARAALITRGLAEMTRLALALGAKEETLYGLSGVGDLILTCTGKLSRNRQVGLELAKGKQIGEILEQLGHISEGINTLEVVLKVARRHQVEMPVAELLSWLLSGQVKADQVTEILMHRIPKMEKVS
ncbi:MAG: NAD(P)H-dependent glycerol-3-phosphate dehydrogenase [Neisseriaceae bacterium]